MNNMDKIVSLAKRRGFVFPSSEIYGGFGGFWDFGPLGVALKNNIKELWWQEFVEKRDDVFGLDASIIMNPRIWEASGHTGSGFADPLRECTGCHRRFRSEDLNENKCPVCGEKLDKEKKFNILVKTFIGPVEDETALTYLRGETAQAIFVNFDNIQDTFHPKLPFGIAQIGKAFRNEITPGKFIFRSREFEQMELEYFIYPESDEEQFIYWKEFCLDFLSKLGLKRKNLRYYDHPKEKLAHYSKGTTDIEYQFPFGWSEIWGIARRSDFDLKQHSRYSGKALNYKDADGGNILTPYVIEPSVGVDRLLFSLMSDAYREDGKRTVLGLSPRLSPYKAAVFPLVSNKEQLVSKAREIYLEIKKELPAVFDDRGNIGKRYYSQDEIGTPWCITIDYDTLEDETVTVRDRDTAVQERVKYRKLADYLKKQLQS
ncbi:MAG: glycyl-tRNA synthetase, glycyl-tRNA synthetase [Candidatus Gottesmanbacteria bacterium GW2011_GWA2_43_14]|uniref:Glycine--tRNA ligase n=1 Tax=Candidatus Gottesmanbacteria bacterium GW2011_GWA2_43_14 TaxID=1618443 RepID=A0A0G1GIG9_9BACT|nr:MAG: glycyl-tRNA synthetase, glycyl-tRNA synthetase [Candidatus Gottesmanbacteria bacterium GW2011_GWA2_43_14]